MKKEGDLIKFSDLKIDSPEMMNFLNLQVGSDTMKDLIVRDVFKNCDHSSWLYGFSPEKNNEIKVEVEKYLEKKAGMVVFSAIDKGSVNNWIIPPKPKKNCKIIGEEEICSAKVNEARSISGYVRIYSC